MSNFTPTQEQEKIFVAAEEGHDIVVAAGAGAGKTSTVVGIAQRTGTSGMLVTFNKSIAEDAQPKLKGTGWTAKTAHSLAYAWMCKPAQRALKSRFSARPNVDWKAVRTFMGARDLKLDKDHTLSVGQVVAAVKQAHKNFCNSADPALTRYHVKRALPELPEGVNPNTVVDHFLPMAQRFSADSMSIDGQMHFGFDELLKSYQLTNPQLAISAIGYDEAQDANPVILDIVRNQKCQKIVVGDSNQQIYEWRGAIDAMETFSEMEGVVTLGLTQSFRFGQAVADVANLFLTALDSRINGEPFRITGFDKIESKVTIIDSPDAVLCRSNAGTLTEAFDLIHQDKRVAIVGGGEDIRRFAFGARELMQDPKSDGGEGTKYQELAAFNNWEEVLQHCEEGEADATFKRMVKLISDWGVGRILHVLASLVSEEEADVTISTAHKAKGREWSRVRIAGDFKPPEQDQEPSKGELRLAYVAVTRAKLELELGGLAWIYSLVREEVEA